MKILSFDVGIKNLSFCVLDDVCEHRNAKTDVRCDKSVKFVSTCKTGCIKLCPAHKKLKSYSSRKFKGQPKKKNAMLCQGKNMVDILTKKDNFLDVDLVVIENQPALKNPTMKSIQMILYSYFLINGVTNTGSVIDNIQLINARNKLKAYTGPPVPCDIKDRYKRTKFLGIQYCSAMIQESDQEEQWIQLFTDSKKKDDLADAYLQGIYVLNTK